MSIRIDKHSGIPVYIQIMNEIKKEILLGKIRLGDKLPPTRELARKLGVNINTVLKAYERLQFENVIQAKHGIGYFVKESVPLKKEILDKIKEFAQFMKEKNMDILMIITILQEVCKNDKLS